MCVRVCVRELRFSSALNRGQRKLIQLSVEANNLLFSQRKKCWCRVLMVQTLLLEHTHHVQTAVAFRWSVIIRECFPWLWWMVCFWTIALCSPTTQLNQDGRLKESATTMTSAISKRAFRLRQLRILVLLSLFISLKPHFLCRTNSACDAVVTVWCYLWSYWVWLLLLWEWGGSASSYRCPGTAASGEEGG